MCNSAISYVVIFSVFQLASSLIKLPSVMDNDILRTEDIIRSTTNSLFSLLGLHPSSHNTKIKQYASIHKYFISLTLQDHYTLTEIAKLTRVHQSNLDKLKPDFTAIINEIERDGNVEKDIKTIKEFKFNNMINYILYSIKSYNNKDRIKDILAHRDSFQVSNEKWKELLRNYDNEENLTIWRDDMQSGRRIYNGQRTKVKNFPFMASLHIFHKFQCAGSIIKSNLILTAASCLRLSQDNGWLRANPDFLSVRVGSSYYNKGGEVINASQIHFYPNFDPRTLRHNIAIVRLSRRIRVKEFVKKIEFDQNKIEVAGSDGRVMIVGWGARMNNMWENQSAGKLTVSDLLILTQRECQRVYTKEYVTYKNFCAGFITTGSGACNRDVGDPCIMSGVLTGIISFGAPVCGTPDAPTVFTNIGFYTDWIEEIIKQDVPAHFLRSDFSGSTATTPGASLEAPNPTIRISSVEISSNNSVNPTFMNFLKKLLYMVEREYVNEANTVLGSRMKLSAPGPNQLKEINTNENIFAFKNKQPYISQITTTTISPQSEFYPVPRNRLNATNDRIKVISDNTEIDTDMSNMETKRGRMIAAISKINLLDQELEETIKEIFNHSSLLKYLPSIQEGNYKTKK